MFFIQCYIFYTIAGLEKKVFEILIRKKIRKKKRVLYLIC
jgi:hypothetical protein